MARLRSLRLLDCQWLARLDANDLLVLLPEATPQLEELELGPCPRITAARLGAGLYSHAGLRSLRRLCLHKAPLTPETVMSEVRCGCMGALRVLASMACNGRMAWLARRCGLPAD